jgi:hypothetical protein
MRRREEGEEEEEEGGGGAIAGTKRKGPCSRSRCPATWQVSRVPRGGSRPEPAARPAHATRAARAPAKV